MSLITRFLSEGAVEHHSSNDGRAAYSRPGYVIAALAIAAVSFEAEATAGVCASYQTALQEAVEVLERDIDPWHRDRVQGALRQLSGLPLGARLVEAVYDHGTAIYIVNGDFLPQQNSAFIADGNVIFVADHVDDQVLPAVIAQELVHAKGFNEGTGAAVTMLEAGRLPRVSFVQSHLREQAAAWAVGAYVTQELGLDTGQSRMLADDARMALDRYQSARRSAGQADALNMTLGHMQIHLARYTSFPAEIEAQWRTAAECSAGDEQQRDTTADLTRGEDVVREILSSVNDPARISIPEHPEDHLAFISASGEKVVIRQWDPHLGQYSKVSNPLGPAIESHGKQVYALHGEVMAYEQWALHDEVLKAQEPTASDPEETQLSFKN